VSATGPSEYRFGQLTGPYPRTASNVSSRSHTVLLKVRTALAQELDYVEVALNPARDKRVKLPRERKVHLPPPLAEHVESVLGLVAPRYVLPLFILAECRPRVSELETAVVGDIDEERKAIRVRPEAERTSGIATSTCRMTSSPHKWRRCRRVRTATRQNLSFPALRTRPAHGNRPRPAGTVVSRTSRHKGCDADADRSTTSALAPGRGRGTAR
jgi:integrase